MKKKIIIAVTLIVLCLCLIGYVEIKSRKIEQSYINIYDITGNGAKSENINVYLNASFIAGNIANYQNNNKYSFYVVFGDEVQYLVYMQNDLAKKINNFLMNNPEKTYRIIGVTKIIPSEMEEYGQAFVKEWLDTNHHHEEIVENHSHEISKEQFYEYFGYVYLDNTIKNNKLIVEKTISYLLGLAGIIVLFDIIKRKIW